MARKHLSARERVELFHAHCGRCHLCGLKIDAGQEWEVSHPIPLAAGGDDVPSNRAPAHKRCHAKQTATIDAPLIAKVRRQHQKHIGAKPKSRAWSTRFRKKVNGQVERRT